MSAVALKERLYLGGAASLAQVGELGVQRMLSLGLPPAPGSAASPPLPEDACLSCSLADDESADLLSLLPRCLAFYKTCATESLTLLIACHAGVSRSAAVAVAVLMAAERLDCDTALDLVRSRHPSAAPNDGFVAQLRLWGAMACTIDETFAPFRRHRAAQHAASHVAGELLSAPPLVRDPTEACGGAAVRCRKCRRLLATAEHTVAHSRGDGARAQYGGGAPCDAALPCSSLFLEPMAWMAAELQGGAVAGKLACPKCACRLGGFSWAGEQCSCGAWVTPAFQLHASRVDCERPRLQK